MDNTKELTEEEEKQQSATITVLASPEQAKLITGLENDGMAHVALISRGNDTLAAQDTALTELYHPELLAAEPPADDEAPTKSASQDAESASEGE